MTVNDWVGRQLNATSNSTREPTEQVERTDTTVSLDAEALGY